METLDARELQAALPPALMLVGEAATLGAASEGGITETDEDWGNDDWTPTTADSVAVDRSTEPADSSVQPTASAATEDAGLGAASSTTGSAALGQAEVEDLQESDEIDELGEDDVIEIEDTFNSDQNDAQDLNFDGPGEATAVQPQGSQANVSEIMMDVGSDSRRKRRGSPAKSIFGVIFGGLLALPIVGIILHYTTGQHVPILSDVLPGGGKSSTSRTAAPPLDLSNQEHSIVEEEPLSGRPIGDELTEETSAGAAEDPADAALSAITAEDSTAMPQLDFGTSSDEAADTDTPQRSVPNEQETAPGSTDVAAASEMSGDDNDPFGAPAPTEQPDAATDTPEKPDTTSDSSDTITEVTPSEEPATPDLPDLPDMAADSDTDLFGSSPAPSRETEPTGEESVSKPDATQTPAFDVDEEVQKVSQSLTEINAMSGDDAQRSEAIQTAYESLSRLGGEVPTDSVSKLRPVLEDISSNMKLVVAFAKAAPGWVERDSGDRGSDGALVVGRISGDSPDAARILLTNGQRIPVSLPDTVTEVPSGIQIGVGQVQGSGPDATLTLDLLQPVKL